MMLMNIFKFFLLVSLAQANDLWDNFKVTYNKSYYSREEEALRRSIFEMKLTLIEEHNKRADQGLFSYWLDINQFTDMKLEEIVTGFPFIKPDQLNESEEFSEDKFNSTDSVPESMDWRKIQGRVGPVKSQGGCGYFS